MAKEIERAMKAEHRTRSELVREALQEMTTQVASALGKASASPAPK